MVVWTDPKPCAASMESSIVPLNCSRKQNLKASETGSWRLVFCRESKRCRPTDNMTGPIKSELNMFNVPSSQQSAPGTCQSEAGRQQAASSGQHPAAAQTVRRPQRMISNSQQPATKNCSLLHLKLSMVLGLSGQMMVTYSQNLETNKYKVDLCSDTEGVKHL